MNIKILIVLLFLCGCSQINQKLGLKDDNFIEEGIETAIKIKTGVDIDLTPESEEK